MNLVPPVVDTASIPHPTSPPGSVTLVGGGPGAWDLLTIRGWRRLQNADVIIADHLGPSAQMEELLDTRRPGLVLIDASKIPYSTQMSQETINALMVKYASAGKRVVRLKGGDPYVFGRGFEEYVFLARQGIACEVVPGVTSAIAGPAAAGIPVTQRGVTQAFTVVSGHALPGSARSSVDWEALAHVGGTIVVIMGVKNVHAIASTLRDYGMRADMPAIIISSATTECQQSIRCTLSSLGDTMDAWGVQPPAVYVIGDVAGLSLPAINETSSE